MEPRATPRPAQAIARNFFIFAVLVFVGLYLAIRFREGERGAEKVSAKTQSTEMISRGKEDGALPENLSGEKFSSLVEPKATDKDLNLAARRQRVLSAVLPAQLQRPGVVSVADALKQIVTLTDDASRSAYFAEVLRFCLQLDPAATTWEVEAIGNAGIRDFGVVMCLWEWGRVEPLAALTWAGEHRDSAGEDTRYRAAYEGYADARPVDALKSLDREDLKGDWDQLGRIALFHCDSGGRLAEARSWIEALPEGTLRNVLINETVRLWALSSPSKAVEWLAAVSSEDTFRTGLGSVVHGLAESQPQLAAELTQQFREPQVRQEYLADAVYLWAKKDLAGAATWLSQQPAGPSLDSAIGRLAEALAPFDPAESKQWIARVSDSEKRAELTRRLNPKS